MKKEHIDFVELYLTAGYTATSAYMEIYPNSEPVSSWVSSSRLLRTDKVKEYVEIRRQEMIDKLGITKEKNLKDLEVIKAMAMNGDKPQLTAANQAIQIQNKMLGLYEPTKIEVEGKGIVFNFIDSDKKDEDSGDGDKL